jgi:membrane-associated protein
LAAIQWIIEHIKWLMSLAQPDNLRQIVNLGGADWVGYAILGGIVFSETGLLVGFFLPGDSLLFAAGFLSSQDVFNIAVLDAVLIPAAICGDACNYFLGRQLEAHVFEKGRLPLVKHSHLMSAKAFYEKHGGRAIVLAKFVPIVRTFTPFVAGVARMTYRRFLMFNVLGATSWILLMTWAGYWLGRFAWIKEHFELVVLGIVLVSVSPVLVGAWRAWRGKELLHGDERSTAD